MKRKSENKKFLSILVKYSIIFIILILGVIDGILTIFKKSFDSFTHYENKDPQILLTLFPAIITIVTISLTLPNEKISELSIFEFRKLRSKFNFSFIDMILITILLFSLHLVSSILKLHTTTLIIELSCIAYSIWFIVTELPILERNDKYIKKVFRNLNESENRKALLLENETPYKDPSLNKAIKSYLFKEGLKNTYFDLKVDDEKINSCTLSTLIDFNLEVVTDYSSNEASIYAMVDSPYLNLGNVAKQSFKTLSNILAFNPSFDLLNQYDNGNFKLLDFTSILFIRLQKLCSKYDYEVLFNEKFEVIFLNFQGNIIFNEQNYKTFKWKFLNQILTITILNKKYWFINDFIMYYSKNSIYKEENFFIIFYISLLFKNNLDGNFSFIQTPIQNPKEYTNEDLQIKKLLSDQLIKFLNRFNTKTVISFTKEFFDIIDYRFKDVVYVDIKKSIINSILEFIFYSNYNFSFDEEFADKIFNSISKENKELLEKVLYETWYRNNEFTNHNKNNNFATYFDLIDSYYGRNANDQAVEFFKELLNKEDN